MSRGMLLRVGFQVAVTAVFVLLAVWLIDLDALWENLRNINPWWVAVALPLFSAAKFVDSFRWRYLLRGVGQPRQRSLFGAFLVGNMVNNLLPLRAGDVAKIQVLATRYGMSRAGVAGSVFVVEATLDAVVFVIFLVIGVTFLDLGALPGVTLPLILGLVAVAVVVIALAVLLQQRGQQLPLPKRLHDMVAKLQEGLDALGSVSRAAGAVALSFPSWLLEAGTFAAMGQAFGLDLPFPVFLAAMVAANLAVAVPIGVWNIGPYEALVSGVLVIAGVDEQLAFSYALTTHLVMNLWINISGLVAFWALGVQPRDLLSLGRGSVPSPDEQGTSEHATDEDSDGAKRGAASAEQRSGTEARCG